MPVPEATPEDKVYAEAGQWVRMVNTVIWSMGSLVLPLSFTLLGLGVRYPSFGTRMVLAIASVCLFGFWVYVSWLYGITSKDARDVLTNIEGGWGLGPDRGLYQKQAPSLKRRLNLFNVQVITLIVLVGLWLTLFATRYSVAELEGSAREAPARDTARP